MLARTIYALLGAVPAPLIRRTRTLRGGASPIESLVAVLGRPLEGRTVVIRHGEARGLRFRAERRSLAWITGKVEPEVQRALRNLLAPGATFVDIGASIGFFSMLGADVVGPGGHVLAFEPSADAATAIRTNAALNGFDNVHVVEHAVSDREGVGLLARPGHPTATLEEESRPSSVSVPTTPLDAFLAVRPALVPSVVKVDVEGHETAVLRGMRDTLAGARPTLIIEMHGDRGFVQMLEDTGYRCSALEGAMPVAEAPWWAHVLAVPRE